MRARFSLVVLGCLPPIVLSAFLLARDLQASQPEKPAPAQDAGKANADQAAANPLQEELKARLQALLKAQLGALELQKKQLVEDGAEQARQIKEQEAEAMTQLKMEFERQIKQINRQANAQIDQVRKSVERQVNQLDVQKKLMEAEVGMRIALMSLQVSLEEARGRAGRTRSDAR